MDGWMDRWMDGCMDGWMDGWMTLLYISNKFLILNALHTKAAMFTIPV
jgi:hypothetical protein